MNKVLKYRIKEFMERADLQHADLADYCRKSRQTISNWCNIPAGAPYTIPRMAMHDICEFFGCKPSDLITDTSDLPTHVYVKNIHQAQVYKAAIK
jgi:DNA-binding Xre family transcriptional regulator